jgi:hypothetical protein
MALSRLTGSELERKRKKSLIVVIDVALDQRFDLVDSSHEDILRAAEDMFKRPGPL